jgi:hypothetical protein
MGQRAGVRLRPDGHDRVDELDLGLGDRRDVVELLVVGLGQQQLWEPLELEVDVRVRPDGERRAVDRDGQGSATGGASMRSTLPGSRRSE